MTRLTLWMSFGICAVQAVNSFANGDYSWTAAFVALGIAVRIQAVNSFANGDYSWTAAFLALGIAVRILMGLETTALPEGDGTGKEEGNG